MGISGILSIVEHGLQQFVSHLNPWTMQSVVFPLNRQHNSASLVQQLAQPETLRLFDLGSSSMFAIFQDSKTFSVKQFQLSKDGQSLSMESISTIDFSKKYPATFSNKSCPLVTEIVALNRTDTVLVTLERKRYLVYNYILGEVVKEILPIRGSYYRACTDY